MNHIRLQRSEGPPVVMEGMGEHWHFHLEVELTFITQGKGLRFVGDDIAHFTAPDLLLIGSNLPHYWQSDGSSGFCIQFEYGPNAPLAGFRESHIITSLIRRANRGLSFPRGVCAEVLRLLEGSLDVSPMIRLTNVLQILQRLQGARPKSLSNTQPVALLQKQRSIQDAVHYIIQHSNSESLQLQDVLEHVQMSRATFSRHFQSALGQSYTQFLCNLRLENARRLLATTDQSITELAFETGFGNLSHFNSTFKKRWDMTPRELRKRLRR